MIIKSKKEIKVVHIASTIERLSLSIFGLVCAFKLPSTIFSTIAMIMFAIYGVLSLIHAFRVLKTINRTNVDYWIV